MSKDEPKLVAQSVDVHGTDNYPNGCKFSPDGLCILTSTNQDSKLRLYNTFLSESVTKIHVEKDAEEKCKPIVPTLVHPWKAELLADGGNAVRCYDWYPSMRSDEPASCCFVATAR
jgi:hypothetical protein